MAVVFKVETDKLLSTAAQFENSARVANTTVDQMIQLVHQTNGQWAGQASDTYRRKFDRHDQDRRDMYSLITEHIQDLRKIAENYARNEQNLASTANSLRNDVVH